EYQTLGGNTPVRHTVIGHCYAYYARQQQSWNLCLRFLFHHQVAEEVGMVGSGGAGNQKT
ncbi:hypothetical protein RFX75_13670, partial [Acinetobacter baumannii]|nr:hypothetical protein [Acinetobacter baumannii]